MARPRGRDLTPYMTQIRDEKTLRFGPQVSALSELRNQAIGSRKHAIESSRGAALGLQAALKEAAPRIAQGHDAVSAFRRTHEADIAPVLSRLGPSADPIRAAMAREGGLVSSQLEARKQSSLAGLQDRSVQAAEGRLYQTQRAEDDYASSLGKIGASAQALGQQEGAFGASRLAELLSQDREISLKRSDARREAQKFDVQYGPGGLEERKVAASEEKARAQGETKPKFTPAKIRDNQDKWDKGLVLARQIKPTKADEETSVAFLVSKGMSPAMAKGAVQSVIYRGVGPKTRHTMRRRYGLKVPGFSTTSQAPRLSGRAPRTS